MRRRGLLGHLAARLRVSPDIAPVAATDCRLKIWRLLRRVPAFPYRASMRPAIEAFFMLG